MNGTVSRLILWLEQAFQLLIGAIDSTKSAHLFRAFACLCQSCFRKTRLTRIGHSAFPDVHSIFCCVISY
jgi:hypothetical protein